MSSAVGALLGKNDCQKRLACLSGRHLSNIDGASSLGKFINDTHYFRIQTCTIILFSMIFIILNCFRLTIFLENKNSAG